MSLSDGPCAEAKAQIRGCGRYQHGFGHPSRKTMLAAKIGILTICVMLCGKRLHREKSLLPAPLLAVVVAPACNGTLHAGAVCRGAGQSVE